MPYRAPTEDFQFLFDHVIGYDQIAETELFAEAPADMAQAVLSEASKMCEEVLAPLNRNGDLTPAKLENGVVRTSPGFGSGYKAIAEGGWIGMAADPEYGGMGLPLTLQTAVNDMMSSACLSLQLCPLMTQGQIEALEHHASDELKSLYLPKLITGEWAGTMNLTEPQAGSDVGALSSKAVENGDGTYSVTGQKIFISWGDNDITENVCHLVLARLPDGVAGTKGISLFLVPKLIPDADGNPGERNSLRVVSLEHKMGLHGSPTAVMSFEGARGWMIGEPHKGMAAMFTMMNNARLGVGVQGYGTGEGAFQQALEYALERKQGRTPLGDAGHGTIVDFADVRRMLTQMKAELFAARAMAMSLAKAIDMGRATGDADWNARAALLTPIVKAYGTETGINVSNMGIQVHGGMGFIEETGAAQYLRDVRVTAIYEGTNGVQAMDLVGRKMMDGGDAAFRLLEEIETQAEGARALFPNMSEAVWSAAEDLRETIEWQVEQTDMQDRFAGAVPFLMGFARVLGAHYHLKAAIAEGGKGPRTELARFHINRLLPEHVAQFAQARAGAAGLYALTPDDLAS
ncbi:acyl-CoA dehydrogenase [Aliiroseovarius crassostreae]|uniref:3-methylmercaptopropionyl-CoA dehydrogenase n=1 Tax=Aliiroseovarius crassostreae TaxID=154981 RepID=A0A9Q9LZK6_9RHOB|nr:acyl-CoA dehydrogenase [Aliiroseovarius crassostreae]UWP95568.1 acyl-CoA dehydrogenase [Aliiroseovarius crassostreae]